MRKLYTLIAVLVSGASAFGQFTLTTSSHGYTTGEMNTYKVVNHNNLAAGSGGASTTWDFSTVQVTSATTTDTIRAASAGENAGYGGANIVISSSKGEKTYIRQSTGMSPDSVKIHGIDYNLNGFQTGPIIFTDPDLIMLFPYSYGSPLISDSFSSVDGNGTSTTTVDGHGTLKIPGINHPVIRVYYTMTYNTTIQGTPVTFNIKDYNWYSQGYKAPVMRVTYRTAVANGFIPVGGDTVALINALATSVEENNAFNSNISVYPNPSKDFAKISLALDNAAQTAVEIYNYAGSVVFSENLGMLSTGNHFYDLNTANIAAGVYTIRITSGDLVAVKKLVVE